MHEQEGGDHGEKVRRTAKSLVLGLANTTDSKTTNWIHAARSSSKRELHDSLSNEALDLRRATIARSFSLRLPLDHCFGRREETSAATWSRFYGLYNTTNAGHHKTNSKSTQDGFFNSFNA